MPPPKSPLDTPSSSHSRRPGCHRRSSSEKSSTKPLKHERKPGESSQGRTRDTMTDSSQKSGRVPASPSDKAEEGSRTGEEGRISASRTSQRPDVTPRPENGYAPTNEQESSEEDDRSTNRGQVPEDTSPGEMERLRVAMNAQLSLTQHRQRLAQQLEGKDERATGIGLPRLGGKTRVSPINEEIASPSMEEAFASPLQTGMQTTSTESAKTIRGGSTPNPMAVRTPSYPFPPMRTPGPGQTPYTSHRPFTALSPTVNPSNYAGGSFAGGPQDQLLSGSITPASTLRFQPQSNFDPPDDPNFETPNLYDLSLMLSAEPGLEAWWTTVVQIMRTLYKADRVTLSIPADPTDIENVPWGQKATFNAVEEDQLSLTYLPRGSSMVPSSVATGDTSNSEDTTGAEDYNMGSPMPTPIRPSLLARHSFTAYENTKREPAATPEASRPGPGRPTMMSRAKSYLSGKPDLMPPRTGTLQNASLSLQSLKDHMALEQNKSDLLENPESSSREVKGRVFDMLQALDYEAEPLIDNEGVLRALKRGTVIALTRDYPYVENPSDEKSGGSKSSQRSSNKSRNSLESKNKLKSPDVGARITSFLGGRSRKSSRSTHSQGSEKGKGPSTQTAEDENTPVPTGPKYEEYEQTPPSPWSQSPAPSPAVRAETSENPFFANAPIDEESFNPQQQEEPQDYTGMQPETIGADRSWTVLHIPLIHPLLSKPVHAFRLDAAAMESKSAGRGKTAREIEESKSPAKQKEEAKHTPIAILSILSQVIPYPSSLRHSLEYLSPHLATSFSLCRHYSNLQTEISGLSRKRPATTGFGAVEPGPRPRNVTDRVNLGDITYHAPDEGGPQGATAGSITSPSDYSGMSRSTVGSPTDTPGWDPAIVGMNMDKRSSGGSPSYTTGESYFSSRARPGAGRVDTGSASSITAARRTSFKESSPAETRPSRFRRDTDESIDVPENLSTAQLEEIRDRAGHPSPNTTPKQEPPQEISEIREPSPSRHHGENPISPRKQAMLTTSSHGQVNAERQHTQLHSYGADFGATFQSLPTTSTGAGRGSTVPKPPVRVGSISQEEPAMPPPSDKVKSIMLDALPLHVFIALPPTGEVVWVNSRYLTYRGQSVKDLYEDPWASIHPDEREEYLKAWRHSLRTGEQLSTQIRLQRFDGTYRWFYTRAVGLKDNRGVIVQWYGTYMDIHDQHVAEVKAARQEEIEASDAKHRQLANLIPQIIFSATEEDGVTFANQQWLSFTGQSFDDAMGLGFMDYVHPDDLAKCHIPPIGQPHTLSQPKKPADLSRKPSQASSGGKSSNKCGTVSEAPTDTTIKGIYQSLSRTNSSSNGSVYEFPSADLAELTRNGVVKVDRDSEGRTSYSTEVRLRSKTGEYRWHLVRCVEVDNISLGSRDGSWFGACADINDHKLLEMKLKEAMDSKSKFLSNMSHEIRTPLIGISGMIGFLQDSPLNDEQIDYCNTIASSADGLLNIINDILDLAKADAGMMKLSFDWFHTRSLVEEVNDMVSTLAIAKNLEVNYVVDIDVPEMIKGDRFRIRQILLNVIGNAIKFTDVGEVFSRCKVLVEQTALCPENQVVLQFSIKDTGHGFTQKEAEVIFRPFSQIDSSSTRTHGGTGLGLVISRQLVELHGGQMEGTAVPGEGSIFTFSAKFGLPTEDDHPTDTATNTPALGTPGLGSLIPSTRSSMRSSISNEAAARAIKVAGGTPIIANKLFRSPAEESPRADSSIDSPNTVTSSGSSAPSMHSIKTHGTHRSSASSVAHSLAIFQEAAQSSSGDVSSMKLALPERHSPSLGSGSTPPAGSPPGNTPTPTNQQQMIGGKLSPEAKDFRPPMYSILLVCPQTGSREATAQHIEVTLPKDVPHQITALASVEEARSMISGEDPILFTHIVLNLGSIEELVSLIDQILNTASLAQTSIILVSDPLQKQHIKDQSPSYDYDQLYKENRVTFINKPIRPSKFAAIFDPENQRDLSTDRNRFNAQQQVATQRQNYLDIGKRLGNRGIRVLLVEDNATNQKVLMKFLSKVGVEVDLALDGVQCTDLVFAKDHSYYSLILCDLHMPNKDGYQACREIREWEQTEDHPRMPIIALSANVMADVLDKCIDAGFSNYITKPVDFKALSTVMGDLLDPIPAVKSGE